MEFSTRLSKAKSVKLLSDIETGGKTQKGSWLLILFLAERKNIMKFISSSIEIILSVFEALTKIVIATMLMIFYMLLYDSFGFQKYVSIFNSLEMNFFYYMEYAVYMAFLLLPICGIYIYWLFYKKLLFAYLICAIMILGIISNYVVIGIAKTEIISVNLVPDTTFAQIDKLREEINFPIFLMIESFRGTMVMYRKTGDPQLDHTRKEKIYELINEK